MKKVNYDDDEFEEEEEEKDDYIEIKVSEDKDSDKEKIEEEEENSEDEEDDDDEEEEDVEEVELVMDDYEIDDIIEALQNLKREKSSLTLDMNEGFKITIHHADNKELEGEEKD